MNWRRDRELYERPTEIDDVGVLFVDDIGVRTSSEAQQDYLLELINTRGDMPTIYTSNHSPEKLKQLFDARIASRLMSSAIVQLTGKDRRLKGTKVWSV